MSVRHAEVLRYLFGLPQSQVDADLATAADRMDELGEAIRNYAENLRSLRSPEHAALDYHQRFLHAHALVQLPDVPEDFAFYWKALVARNLADEVGQAAYGQGRLAEIRQEMEVIEQREGLQKGEYWEIGEGPKDYQALSDESDALHEKVLDGVIVESLRRYHFDDLVKLFQEDRMAFEVRNEVGRRLANPEGAGMAEANRWMEERLINEFGRQAGDLLRKRLKAAGLPP